jgi:hypothetical protein
MEKHGEVQDIRIDHIERSGRQIMRVEVFNMPDKDEFKILLGQVAAIIRSKPENSVLLLTVYNKHIPIPSDLAAYIEYLKLNKPFVKASAFCGAPVLLVPLINAVVSRSGRENIRSFRNEDEAVDWLLSRGQA